MIERRGFTLVETLVVVALLAVIAALATPALLGRGPQVRFATADDQLRSALTMARARAMEDGRPVTVYAEERDGTVRITMTMSSDDDADQRETDFDWSDSEEGFGSIMAEPVSDETATRLLTFLPRGVRLVTSEQFELELEDLTFAFDGDTVPLTADDDYGPDERGDPLLVTVFLPDGSAPRSPALMLISERGAAARLQISASTGITRIVAVDSADERELDDLPTSEDPFESEPEGTEIES